MSTKRDGKGRRRADRRPGISLESLERRSLLTTASETFTGPSLSGLITQADHGKNTTPAITNRMLRALETQLQAGPLADLSSGTVTSNGFVAESQSLEASYEQNVDQQLSSHFANVDDLLKLQGQRVVADLVSLNQQKSVGLISSSDFATSSRTAIASLTAGPIHPLGTSLSGLASTTTAVKSELKTLEQSLASGTLSIGPVKATLDAELEAYRASVHSAIQVTQLGISNKSDTAINILETAVIGLSQTNPANAATRLKSAINTFDNAVLDTNGVFGPRGAYSKAPKTVTLRPGFTNGQAPSDIDSVSGTSNAQGTATLTATLALVNGSPIMGQKVNFTLDGAFAGIAVTNFTGVATLSGVPTTNPVGTEIGGVVASFASNTNFLASQGSGNLVVSQAATTLSNIFGTSSFGGQATLTATLTASATGQGLAGQTVRFTVDNKDVGTAVTNGNGVAILTGITTTDAVGTDNSGIVASFAGDVNHAATNGTGNLVVSQATASLGSVAGTALFGGTATLSATLNSAVTSKGAAGETVSFTLDGAPVGTAVTDSNGVATLKGVATTNAAGTDTGGVVASFAGDANYAAVANATGNLVVTQAATTIGSVAGTASLGGKATLNATLTSAATNQGVAGQTVTFTLDGTVVGTAVTNSSGVATLTGVTTKGVVGTDTAGILASFAGGTSYTASAATGNLVVSPPATALAGVSGTATFGGKATLTATLTSSATNLGISGQTVSFTLNGIGVGTAVTNSSGVASITGVSTSAAVGTDTGGVVASFAGTTNFAASAATGNLVVTQAGTSLGSVSGTATVGGKATLTATLTSSATNLGAAGQTVSFKLDGTMVGIAVTNSSGVATLAGVSTTDAFGTDTGGVVASFTGGANYLAAPNATGNLVVTKASTLGSVSGTSVFGGPATLTASLTATATGQGISGATVSFTLDGTVVGTAVTNSSGVATLAGVTTIDSVGIDSGGVVASFGGDSTFSAANATGNLVVGQAPTSLGSVAGTASFGGKAVLNATLTSSVTNQGVAGQTVSFKLDGTVVGTAVTNSSGVATLTGVTTTDAVGNDMGGVVASFVGSTDYAPATDATGNLLVTKAATTLTRVSGTATGGTATLKATLTSSATNKGIAGESVTFMLDKTDVGTAVTDSSGVATLTGVPTTDAVGTDTGGVIANFAGDNDYQSSQGTGNLTVS